MLQSQSFNEVIGYAQDFAAEREQNIVDISTIALSILQVESPFSEIFSHEEKDKLTEQLIKKTEEMGTYPLETEMVPLTMNAGLLIKFARQYAVEAGDGEVDVYHLMLGLLSYANDVSAIFGKSGWVFENYLAAVNKIVSPEITVGRLELDLKPSVTEPYPKLRKRFWAEDYKNNIVQKLTDEANRHATFGKYDTCRQLCEVVLDITQADIAPYRLIIYSLCNEKKYEEAITQYTEWGTEDDIMRLNIGICYRETGQHEKALEIFNTFDDVTADLHNLKGYSLCALKRYDAAIAEYDAAIAMNPEYSFAYNNKGYALMRAGRLQEAKDNILRSLELDKGNAFAYRNLALVNIEEKNKAEALANIDKALFFRYREKFGDDIDGIMERANAL